jgi:hypothetical protein
MRRVQQLHGSGCFIGCVAIFLEITYEEAFSRVYPNRHMPLPGEFYPEVGLDPNEALAMMPKLGLEIKQANLKSVRSLRTRTSLIILRWKDQPYLMHALVFDGERGVFIDPHYKIPLNCRAYNYNLDSIYYVRRISNELSIRNTISRGNQNTGRLSNRRGLQSSQASAGDALFV